MSKTSGAIQNSTSQVANTKIRKNIMFYIKIPIFLLTFYINYNFFDIFLKT